MRPNGPVRLNVALLNFLKGALVYHLTVSYIGSISATSGISMLPTIPHNFGAQPWIMTSKLHRRGRNIRVGDVVIYAHPMIPGAQGAKRVVGMPGDFVSVLTPGKRDEDMDDESIVGGEVREEMIQVPEGHCWLAGDNLEWSRDSRVFGPVPLGLVRGKVLAIIWPWSRMGWLRNSLVDPSAEEVEWRTA